MFRVTQEIDFCYGHRLLNYGGKCRYLHGHNGRALLFAQHHLEEFARAAGLPPLKAYFSSDPAAVADYLRDQGIATDPDQFADEAWFDPADALPTVRLCREQLADPPPGLGQVEKVRDDLAAVEAVLVAAGERGVRFHIATRLPELNDPE